MVNDGAPQAPLESYFKTSEKKQCQADSSFAGAEWIYPHRPTLVKLDFILPGQWLSTGGDFAPRGHLTMSGVIFGCHNGLGRGSYWQ